MTCFCIIDHLSTLKWHRLWKSSFVENMGPFILQGQCHGYWWPINQSRQLATMALIEFSGITTVDTICHPDISFTLYTNSYGTGVVHRPFHQEQQKVYIWKPLPLVRNATNIIHHAVINKSPRDITMRMPCKFYVVNSACYSKWVYFFTVLIFEHHVYQWDVFSFLKANSYKPDLLIVAYWRHMATKI